MFHDTCGMYCHIVYFDVSNCRLSLRLNIDVLWQCFGKRSGDPEKVLEFFGSMRVRTLCLALVCCKRVSQPTTTGHLPFTFQLTFCVRVYIDRGCRVSLCLLSHAYPVAGRAGQCTYLSELSSDVSRSTCIPFTGDWTTGLCSVRCIYPRIMRGRLKSDYSRRALEFRAEFSRRPNVSQIYSWLRTVETFGNWAREGRPCRALSTCAVCRWPADEVELNRHVVASDTGQLGYDDNVAWTYGRATPSELRRGRALTNDVDAVKVPTRGRADRLLPCFDVDRGTETRSLRPSSAVLRRRWTRHAAHVVELLPLSLLLLKLSLSRVLSSMLRLYARVVCLF